MIYSVWVLILFSIALFAWFSVNRKLALASFVVIAFPILFGLINIQGNAVDCEFDKKRLILGYQINEEEIYLMLSDNPPIFCKTGFEISLAEKLTQEIAVGPQGQAGQLVTGQGQGGEASADIEYPEGDYTK